MKNMNTMKTLFDLNEHLAGHFTLGEMLRSGQAIRLGIDNIPGEVEVEALRALCQNVLEPLRQQFGRILISSGYRCERLNKAVGGVANSQHLLGEAADIHCSSIVQAQRYFDYIACHLDFDQLLLERRLRNGCCWIHVSYAGERNRKIKGTFSVR